MFKRILFLGFSICLAQGIKAQKTDSGWYVPGYTEQIAMSYFNSTTMLAPVEGIWQSSDGYKYAIEKDVENGRRVSSKFRVIVIESSFDGWELGEIKGFITQGSVESIYSFKYYTRPSDRSSTSSQNVFLMIESPVIMTFERIDASGKIAMYRIYPQVDGSVGGGSASQSIAPQWYGSGIVIADKYIATNNHVVENAQSLAVSGVSGDFNKTYKVQVVAVDKNNDLAIVKVIDEKFQGFGMIPYGFNFSTVDVGTEIFALGYPKTDIMGYEVKVTNGIINSKTGFQGDVSRYQMSATITNGNSGGPVFDYKGNLIGISVSGIAKADVAQNVNYAVKSIYLQTLIQSCTEKINVPNGNIIANFQLSDKIKAITPFVLMIIANTETGNGIYSTSGISQGSPMPQQGPDKERAEFLEKRAREKYGNQDYYGAYADIKESVRLFPKPESHHLRYYVALTVGNDTALAIESLKYCISNNYELEDCNGALGYIYSIQKKYNEAITYLTSALAENKRNVGALYTRALCKTGLNDKVGAIADYMQAIKYEGLVDGNYGTIYNNLAFAYLQMNNYELAEKYIKEALKRERMEWYIWDTDGELAYKIGDYERCVKSMNNAITINKYENSYYYRILAKIKLNNLLGAYHDIEILKTMNKERADSLIRTIDVSKIDFEQEDGYEEIIATPIVGNKSHNYLYVKAIEKTSEYTAIHFIISAVGTDGYSYNVDRNSFIQDETEKYYLLKADKIALNPQVSNVWPNMKEEFVLYFPAVNKECTSLSFYNEVGDVWFIHNIQMKSSVIKNEDWNKTQKGGSVGSSNVKYLPGAMQINVDGYGTIEMIKVEAGSFKMGATKEQGAGGVDNNEYPVHSVTIVNDYYIGKFEVTQRLWNFVMKKNPSGYIGDELPVANVTWKECQEFIVKLRVLTGKNFRLPTEAEWEFAARGGNKSCGYKYSGSNVLDDVAWHRVNARGRLQLVGTKRPNELGIYDMSGNVLEWCYDYYGKYNLNSQASPKGPESGVRRVLRGGAVRWESTGCRVSARYGERAGERDEHFGFRLACD